MNEFILEQLKRLEELQKITDLECAHQEADGILCEVLNKLGLSDLVEAYNKINKWYA